MRVSIALFVLAAACRPSNSFDYLSPPSGNDGRTGLGMLDARLASAMRATYKAQAARVEAPMSLAPSDGSELVMKGLTAKVGIDGPIAHTELHFRFHNAEPRIREGRFRIELPVGAAIGRFAMLVNGEWREARVVARDKGRQVYEGFLHQKVDPALLEQDLGNQFSARVFPIPAKADKEIIIGYDQLVSAEQPYTLGLKGLPAIPQLAVSIDHDGVHTDYNLGGNLAPDDIISQGSAGDMAVAHAGGFVARVSPPVTANGTITLDRTFILVDTSASRATVMGKQVELVRRLVAGMPADATVAIAAFDHEVTELFRGPAAAAKVAVDRLFDHGALGASDLGGAISRAAISGMTRVVLVGDGMPTLGETDAGKLAARIRGSAIARFDVLQVSGTLDRDLLAVLVQAGKQPGAIVDGREPRRALRQLATVLAPEVPIVVHGATEVWPKTTRGIAPGEPIFITGRGAIGSTLSIVVGGRGVQLAPRVATPTQVDRAVARTELADLTEKLSVTKVSHDRAVLEARVEKVALEHNLVSARTSLLVLESDADEMRTLGPRVDPKTNLPIGQAAPRGGEVIRITDRAPTIDPTSTTQGITIDKQYTRNIPVPGRTFEAALGAARGSQNDGKGISFSGSTSLENRYFVDGINTTGLSFGATVGGTFTGTSGGKETPKPESPYTGALRDVMTALARNERDRALDKAARWRLDNPGDIAAVIALGEALEARGASTLAARAYGSLIDLYPNRDDIVRAAGERLDRIGAKARDLAIDAYRRALRERPDRPSTYRLLAYALIRGGRADEALDVVLEGYKRSATSQVGPVMLQDARVIAAHLAARDPARTLSLRARIGGEIPSVPSMHIVLSWETDANDVDLHVMDRHGNTALYSQPKMKTGGALHADLTDGFGPEMFSVDRPKAFPYTIGVHYFSRGPMGLGIGTVQVIRHDGNGNLDIEDRPFVLQKDGATIGLGVIK